MSTLYNMEHKCYKKYNEMMLAREGINIYSPHTCAKCHRPYGNHLSSFALKYNPKACRFVKKQ